MYDRIIALREGGAVRRFHTHRTLRTQTVADHSHGVAMLVLHVYPEAEIGLLKAALYHDLSEGFTGDIPAPAKWLHPPLAEVENIMASEFRTHFKLNLHLTQFERQVLKWCDLMELIIWSLEDFALGNEYSGKMFLRAAEATKEPPTAEAAALMLEVMDAFKELQ